MSAREGCPAWCIDHHDPADDVPESIRSYYDQHQAIRQTGSGLDLMTVCLLQIADMDNPVSLYVGTVAFPLDQAPALARLMREMSRGDVAAAVEELAALAVTDPAAPAFT